MRQEYLSNDRVELDEPKLYVHRCIQCGCTYVSYLEEHEIPICEVCADEKVYSESEAEEYLGFSLK